MTELEKGATAQAVRDGAQTVQKGTQAIKKNAQAVPAIGPKMADLLVAYLNQLISTAVCDNAGEKLPALAFDFWRASL